MLFVSYAAEAKFNSDSGYVMVDVSDKDTKELIPFANVVAYQNGVQVAVGTTNMDGRFLFKNLAPGKYDVKAIYVGYLAQVIKDIEVGAGKTTSLYFKLDGRNEIVCYDITYCCCCFGCYNGYSGENWWPKLWTPYREAYAAWKEKREKKKAIAAKEPKKEIELSEESDEHGIADSIETARIALVEEVANEIKIYPNPASGMLFIESDNILNQVSVLNVDGKLVKEEIMNAKSATMNLDGLANGIYYLSYTNQGKTETKTIVVVNE
ncbi:MAG: carboxypeptidase regulatory-like domain-containing protein [Bacteroidia bacterium]|nr:carboxypeptidase regulatory-like domain-containing protein [Bacteroidia bacterium]